MIEEKIEYLGDTYVQTYLSDGSRNLYCQKDKDGFEILINIGGTPVEKKQSFEAVKNFYIHNML